jgi:hypothetical protein
MSESTNGEGAAVMTDGRPTPMVLSVARRLRDSLAAGLPLTPSELPRVVCLSSVTDAQKAFVTFWGSAVVVSADCASPVDYTWEVRWADPAPSLEEAAQDDFEQEVRTLLNGPQLEWRDAVESFWARTKSMPGMPSGLVVYCFEEDATLQLGDPEKDVYQLLGTSGALTDALVRCPHPLPGGARAGGARPRRSVVGSVGHRRRQPEGGVW